MELHPEPCAVLLSYMKSVKDGGQRNPSGKDSHNESNYTLEERLMVPTPTGVRARINNIDESHTRERHFFPGVESARVCLRDSPRMLPLGFLPLEEEELVV